MWASFFTWSQLEFLYPFCPLAIVLLPAPKSAFFPESLFITDNLGSLIYFQNLQLRSLEGLEILKSATYMELSFLSLGKPGKPCWLAAAL